MSAEKFKQLMTKTDSYLQPEKRFTKVGKRVMPFARLKQIGVKNYTTLKKEYKKVLSQSSNRPHSERETVKFAYALCQQENTTFINVLKYQDYLLNKAQKTKI